MELLFMFFFSFQISKAEGAGATDGGDVDLSSDDGMLWNGSINAFC